MARLKQIESFVAVATKGSLTAAALAEGVAPALQDLIERSLAKDRALRPADWDEFATSLSSLISQRQVPNLSLIHI